MISENMGHQLPETEEAENISLLPLSELGEEELFATASKMIEGHGISQTNREKINEYLKSVKEHDLDTYKHSLRVGILAARSSNITGYPIKPLLISGLLHDIGKTEVDADILKKQTNFSQEDYEVVKGHVLEGFNLLKDDFAYSAAILVRHHSFQESFYPRVLPEFQQFLKDKETEITEMAKIVSILDFYDAITTRNNQKFKNEVLDRERIKGILVINFPDDESLVEALYTSGVLV